MGEKVDKQIKKKKLGLVIILLLLFLSTFIILYTQTTFFNVKNVDVIGNSTIEKEKIIMASGLIMGENIFKVNTSLMEDNLLLHPYIKSIEVSRKFPNKIKIDVLERRELSVISYVNSYIYIDEEGIVLNILSKRKEDKLPILMGLNIEKVNIGEKIVLNRDKNIDDILNFLDTCKKITLFKKIRKLEFNKDFKVNMYLRQDTEVAIGYLNNVKYKLEFLNSIIDDSKKKNIKYKKIDLSKGDDAIIELYEK